MEPDILPLNVGSSSLKCALPMLKCALPIEILPRGERSLSPRG